RIHGKPYLLLAEERQRQLRVQRERRWPLNPRRNDDDASPSTRPRHSPGPSLAAIQSPGPTKAPTQSPDPIVQPTIPTAQPFKMVPVDRRCIGQRRTMDRKRGRRGALLFTNLHHRMGFKHSRRW
ncbi:hypothetical protein Gotur_002350, partial [Gossypium turneri]